MNRHLNAAEIRSLEKRHRTNLINSLGGFKSANLIGTTDGRGNHNLAIFNSVVHIGANPPLMGFILRPHTVARHTLENIKEYPWFTINQVHKNMLKQAHQTAAKFKKGESEFEAVGLTPENSQLHNAPYVHESLIKTGLKYVDEELIKINKTILIIGAIQEIFLPVDSLNSDFVVNPSKADGVSVVGLDAYFLPKPIIRYSHPRKGQQLTNSEF